MARKLAEDLEDVESGVAIIRSGPNKQGKVINKEKIGKFRSSRSDAYRGPVVSFYLSIYSSGESFHAKNEEVG